MKKIKICDDFTDAPGGRYNDDGPKSGQEFREKLLKPAFSSLNESEKLTIDLDGCFGYATSFVEEAFGGLARECGIRDVLAKLLFISEEEPTLIDEILGYIKDANK